MITVGCAVAALGFLADFVFLYLHFEMTRTAATDLMDSQEPRDLRAGKGWRKGLGSSLSDSKDLTTFFTVSARPLRFSLR